MNPTARRLAGLLLAAVLVIGIVVAVIWGSLNGGTPGGGASGGPTGPLTVVTGVIGSEKKAFFDDPDVKAIFAKNGLDVQVTTAGSRQIATSVDLDGVDFVFPSSAPAAEKIKRETGAKTVYSPFYSPMAIATFTPIVEILQNAGIANKDADGIWHLDMAKYLAAVKAGTRWNELPGAADTYNSSRTMLISSTDIRKSNSAAMYLSIASYVANGDQIVSSPASQSAVIDELSNLFLSQGFSASSSEEPFDDYLSQGIGSKPMVMVYEAQFLGRQMSETGGKAITKDMVLMYPSPTVFSKHAVVPLTDAGDTVGTLLVNDPDLARLAALYGFRPADPTIFADELAAHGITVPPTPVNVVEPPSFESLEAMITDISTRYDTPAAPAAPDSTPTP
jgi:hypothetical protein